MAAPLGCRRDILVDARCLQDPNYADRGIGRHVLGFLRGAPRDRVRLVGIADPEMRPLIAEAQEVFELVLPNAYAAALASGPGACFLGLCTMTHDPMFVAALVDDARLRRVSIVYDFIPFRHADFYLPGAADRLDYKTRLYWLSRHDAFAANSVAVADDLIDICNVPRSAVAVTGAPLDPGFEIAADLGGQQRRHVLTVGGADPRKNPEVVIRAHARSRAAQAGRIPLVIGGNYDEHARAMFAALYVAEGGRAELIEVPGHVPELDLLRAYGRARVVVCPSRDEGFSLPVIEGMAAGAPVLVSDIPPHRELVTSPEFRFAPDDDAGLAQMMDRVITDDQLAARIKAEQSAVWPRFRAGELAGRFWDFVTLGAEGASGVTIDRRVGRAGPDAAGQDRARIAVMSPMPPDKTGIADYSATMCEALARYAEVAVFTDTRDYVKGPGVSRVHRQRDIEFMRRDFDRVVAVMGNSDFHLDTFKYLRTFGASCIAHDARMFGFYWYLKGLDKTAELAAQEVGREVTKAELHTWLEDESTLEAQFMGELAESATPIIVHSRESASFIQDRYALPATYLPFAVQRPWDEEDLAPIRRADARARLGIPDGEVVVASFGSVHPTKAPEDCIWALDLVRSWGMPATLHLVGSTELMPDGGAGLRQLTDKLGLTEHVRFYDSYVREELYREYLLAADYAIQLRTFGFGSISGAVSDCAEVGLPTVLNLSLHQAVDAPSSYFRTVDDKLSPVLVAERLTELWTSGISRDTVGPARAAFHAERSMDLYARRLCAALGLMEADT